MRRVSLVATIALSIVLILIMWAVAKALGFQISLAGSIAVSVGLTLVANLILAAFGRRGRVA